MVEDPPPTPHHQSPARSCLGKWWFWAILAAAVLVRLAYLAGGVIELSPDEAVYWQYSRRLDWCYYTKGPLVAYLIWLGTRLAGHTELGVRLPAVLLSAAGTAFLCRLYERLAPDEPRGVPGLLLAQHCAPLFVAGSVLMTIDNPLCASWAIGLWALHVAVRDGRRLAWLWLALAFGAGLMAKLAMGFFAVVVLLYLVLSRQNRRWLRTPWPYLALAGGCMFLLPQVWWNAQHDWVMLKHTAGRAGGLRLDRALVYPLQFLAGQMGVASPVLFALMVIALVQHVRRWRRDASLFVVSAVAPVALFFAGLSLFHSVNENWPAAMYPGLALAAALWWAPRWAERTTRRWVVGGLALGGVMVLVLLWPGLVARTAALASRALQSAGWRGEINAERLPHARLLGWRAMAAFAAEQASAANKPVFFLSHRADQASLLAFYLPGRPWTYALPHAKVSTQYDVWGGLNVLKGYDAVFVRRLRPAGHDKGRREQLGQDVENLFSRCEGGEISAVEFAGQVVARHQAWLCRCFRGWPPAAVPSQEGTP